VTAEHFMDNKAVIFGCGGLELSPPERDFFQTVRPAGFILFARNCDNPDQVKKLVRDLRLCLSRDGKPDMAVPVLIDQEGGRVQRLRPPHWRDAPAAARFLELADHDRDLALEACRLNARLIANDLLQLGITVNCAPVVDVPTAGADAIISDRAWGRTADEAVLFGRSVSDGLLSGGVLPILKHIPGHGRATVDSHHHLPRVTATMDELEHVDFKPFKALSVMPWAMTAHIVYRTLDDISPATCSKTVIQDIIRGDIGFDGVLISDDLSMKALCGDFSERARSALNAGCDLVLHCNGDMAEMESVASGVDGLSGAAKSRLLRAEQQRLECHEKHKHFDENVALQRLNRIFDETG